MVNGGVEQDDQFFSKLLSREKCNTTTTTNKQGGEASFRVLYYGGAAGSVPFTWESQPGTPKHAFNDNPLPPLTPPPSYMSSPRANPSSPSPLLLQRKQSSKNSKFFNSIFPRAPSKKINASNSPPAGSSSSSSSSFSSSYSLPSTPFHAGKENNFKTRSRSSVRLGMEEDHEYEEVAAGRRRNNSPTSTLCFGPSSRRFRGYSYPIKSVKKAVLSIVGHGNN
ncbi:hypothetical protein ACP275_06G059000 [Erythranthe tilingii]